MLNHKKINFIGLVLVFSLPIAVFIYAAYVNENIIRADQWRFLFILDNYYAGKLSLSDFFTSHSSHIKPGYKVLFLLNAITFNLNLYYEALAGLIFLFFASYILYSNFKSSIDLKSIVPKNQFIYFLPVVFVFYSFNQKASYTYSLLSLGGFAGLLLFVLIWVKYDSLLREKASFTKVLFFIFLCVFTALSFSGARFPALLISLLIVLVINQFYSGNRKRNFFYHISIWCLITFSSQLTYWMLGSTSQRDSQFSNLLILFTDVFGSVKFFLFGLAGSLTNISALNKLGVYDVWLLCVGWAVLLLYLYSLFLYLKTGMRNTTYVPLFLIIYSLTFLGMVLVARYGAGFPLKVGASPRYVFDSHLGLVGCVWIIVFHLYNQHEISLSFKKTISLMSSSVLIFILIFEAFNTAVAVKMANYQNKWQLNAATDIVSKNFSDKRTPLCPNRNLCLDGADLLEKHQLNVFSSNVTPQ